MIRLANNEDFVRIAEILVFNNRKFFYPIFKDIKYSFQYFTVVENMKWLENHPDLLKGLYVYEDEDIIKGFVIVKEKEVVKLYVDTFFQNEGIGGKMLSFAIKEHKVNHLWALEKNMDAIRFYIRYGFHFQGNKKLEENTTEYLVELVKDDE